MVSETVKMFEGFDALLSPEDAGLTNAWEEVCVQVQGEESVDWDTYLGMIHDYLDGSIEELTRAEQTVLWLSTDAGDDWRMAATDEDVPPVFSSEVIAELESEILALAADADSQSIERYLHGNYADDDEAVDEEDEDEDEDEGEGGVEQRTPSE